MHTLSGLPDWESPYLVALVPQVGDGEVKLQDCLLRCVHRRHFRTFPNFTLRDQMLLYQSWTQEVNSSKVRRFVARVSLGCQKRSTSHAEAMLFDCSAAQK